jgi:hypothetical protein
LSAQREEKPIKAVVMNEYGGPEVLKSADYPDPTPGPGGRQTLEQRQHRPSLLVEMGVEAQWHRKYI